MIDTIFTAPAKCKLSFVFSQVQLESNVSGDMGTWNANLFNSVFLLEFLKLLKFSSRRPCCTWKSDARSLLTVLVW